MMNSGWPLVFEINFECPLAIVLAISLVGESRSLCDDAVVVEEVFVTSEISSKGCEVGGCRP
jgi:hypothetical protein